MRRSIQARLDASADRVFATLADLSTYAQWLDIVRLATPADAHELDGGPAWFVTLRARVGPLARSKRLRMVRTITEAPSALRFERAEIDGRDHSPWILDATITGDAPCAVEMHLAYEGRLWTAPLGAILGSEADDAVPRLQALVEGAG